MTILVPPANVKEQSARVQGKAVNVLNEPPLVFRLWNSVRGPFLIVKQKVFSLTRQSRDLARRAAQ